MFLKITIATTVLSLGMMGAAQAGTIIVPDSATANVGLLIFIFFTREDSRFIGGSVNTISR